MLETAPSLCIYSSSSAEPEPEGDSGKDQVSGEAGSGSGDFSFSKTEASMEEDEELVVVRVRGNDFNEVEQQQGWSYCSNNNDPVALKKYAHFLQRKGELHTAEEYYFRASQADPRDGEILAQLAKLVWDLHRDHERALTYFDLAAETAPDNSIVMAAYAKFLWETEDNGDDQSAFPDTFQKSGHLLPTDGTDVDADDDDLEMYYKRMINDEPSHPIFLKKYAQFLYESKKDLHGAEEYYSRAIQAEPQDDGEMLSQFATLLWELYHDRLRTLNYLEQAIKAAPQNSNVLAAYARILWTIDE